MTMALPKQLNSILDPARSIIVGDSSSSVAIVQVHGAWHIPEHYRPLLEGLSKAGYFVVCPFLPTCNDVKPPNKTIFDDLDVVRKVVACLADAGKDIYINMHSFGGLVGSLSVNQEDLKKSVRVKMGKPGGVVALNFMCAFTVFDDKSLADGLPGGFPPWIEPQSNGTLTLVRPDNYFYHDLPLEMQEKLESMLVCHPIAAQTTKLPGVNYDGVKLAYFICDEDRALLPLWQRGLIENLQNKGFEIKIGSCGASHSPFRSMPERVVEFLREIIAESTF